MVSKDGKLMVIYILAINKEIDHLPRISTYTQHYTFNVYQSLYFEYASNLNNPIIKDNSKEQEKDKELDRDVSIKSISNSNFHSNSNSKYGNKGRDKDARDPVKNQHKDSYLNLNINVEDRAVNYF